MRYFGMFFIVAWFGLLYYVMCLGDPEVQGLLIAIVNGLG